VTLTTSIITILLVVSVIVEALSVTGLIAMRTPLQRLHYVGPATVVGPTLIGVAVTLGTHATPAQGAKGLLVAALLAAFNGVVSHDTGCAALAREDTAA